MRLRSAEDVTVQSGCAGWDDEDARDVFHLIMSLAAR